MSLVVWLPLTKDLRQQGLSNATVTNNGATFNSAGKLGGCYSFDGSDDGIRIDGDIIPQLQQNNFSICFWLFSNDAGDRSIYIATTPASDWGFSIEKTTANKLRVYWQSNPDFNSSLDIPDQQWCHIAVVIKDGNCYCYKNGEKLAERTSGDMTPAKLSRTWIYAQLGRDTRTGSTVLKGKMNDFRWYDHALSQMEVKELAKGLVLHYPLNRQGWGQENLLKNSNFLQGTNGMQGYTATSATCTKQTDCMKVVSTSASGGFYTSNFNSITTGDMTTFSADVKANSNMTIYIGTDGSGNGSCQAYTVGTSWQRISISKAKTTNNANLRIYGNGTFYAKNLKYELGSIATPWCPNSSDTLATTMGLNSTIEYDCSGFGNNGTRTGTFNWTSDTPKYQVSSVFDSSSIIDTPVIITSTDLISQYTAAVWIKRNNTSTSGNHCFFTGPIELFIQGSTSHVRFYWSHATSTSSMSNNTWDPSITINNSIWTHIVVTFADGVLRCYINGELSGTSDRSSTGQYIYGNKYHTIGSFHDTTEKFIGQICDVRAYAAALSTDDVKSLYQNSAYIDSSGNVYGAVHEEV